MTKPATVKEMAKIMGVKLTKAEEKRMQKEMDAWQKEWDAAVAPILKAIEDSERLTAADYAVVINAR